MDALAYFSHLGNQSLPTMELTKTLYYTQTYTNLLLSLQLTTPKQFTKHGQKYKSFEDFLMMEVMSNLIYKRN